MAEYVDPRIVAFCGSRTRALTLGVLANAEGPLTGYRIAKVARLPQTKVYLELRRGIRAGLVQRKARGFRLTDPDLREFLQKKLRLAWSDDWFVGERRRLRRAKVVLSTPMDWFDSSRYRPNPRVARRYAKEIERPTEKDTLALRFGGPVSRKRG